MIKGVAYVRVSTAEQAEEGRSLQLQEQEIRAYADRHGIELVEVFVEAASAFRSDVRSEFNRMCKFLERNQIVTVLVVWKITRALRNFTDFAYIMEQARNGKGIHLLSVTEGFPETNSGQLMAAISAAYGRWQSQVIGEQASANMKAWAERGVYPSRAPVGYHNKVRGHHKQRGLGVEIDPAQAPKVLELYELYASGHKSIRGIFEHARQIGLETCFGTVKSKSTIHKLLSNPFYIGEIHWLGETYQGIHEPIVPVGLFNRVQELLSAACVNSTKGGKHFELKGLTLCLECGGSFTAYSKTKKNKTNDRIHNWIYYACHQKRHALCRKTYEEKVLFERSAAVVEPLHIPPDALAFIERDYELWMRERRGPTKTKLSALAKEAQQYQSRLDSAFESYIDRKVPEDVWQRKSAEWASRIDEINREVSSLRGVERISSGDVMQFLDAISHLREWYLESERFEQATILRAVTSNLLVGQKKIVPVYKKGFDKIARSDWYAQEDDVPTLFVLLEVDLQDVQHLKTAQPIAGN